MKVTARCTAPDDVQISLTLSGGLKEFKELAAQLNTQEWPAYDLRLKITSVINSAERHFYPTEE